MSKEAIGLRVGKIVGRYKVGKHLRLDIADNHFGYERDLESIAAEAALDGFYVIRSGVGRGQAQQHRAGPQLQLLAGVERASGP